MTRRLAVAIVLAAAVLPRLVVLLAERGEILASLVEKSDRFAQTLVASGTFGFLPGRPSGYTQPLYAWFLAGLYQVFERHWLVVGVAHIVLAAVTAFVILEIGRRVASLAVGVAGATIATLHPFLVWHDMHLNREVLDGLLLAVVTLLAVLVVERTSKLQLATSSVSAHAAGRGSKLQVATSSVLALALALGVALGLAILGNARLALLPLVLAAYVAWPLRPPGRALVAAGAVLASAILVVTPWMARNEASVGCFVLTTDTRALWKANNENTYETLARGDWIDDVTEPPNGPPWPELAADRTLAGMPTEVDECEQQRYYRELVFDFWREEPGEKARLSAQAVGMLWSPTFSVDSDDGGRGRVAELGRDVVEPAYMVAVYALALMGAFFVPRRFLALVLLLEAYSTLAAMAFAGTVRYRAPFDFLLALLAAAALARAVEWWRRR